MVPAPPSRFGVILFLASSAGLPQNEITIAEQAKSKGYKTGLIGIQYIIIKQSVTHCTIFHGVKFTFYISRINLRD